VRVKVRVIPNSLTNIEPVKPTNSCHVIFQNQLLLLGGFPCLFLAPLPHICSLSLSLYLAMVVTCGFGFGIVGHFTCSQKLVQRGFASSHVHDLRLRPIYYVYLNNLTKCTFGYSLLKREVIGKQLLCKKIFFIKTWFS
jgi:hypothetical protein